MKTYGCVEMKLDKEPFEKIKSGEKTIELRCMTKSGGKYA